MDCSFGVWLKNYEGDETWLRKLSASWTRALGDDYLKAFHYRNSEDVLRRMLYRTRRHVQLRLDIYRAWHHFRLASENEG